MTTLYRRLIESPHVPWRLRNTLEQWVESHCRRHQPDIYRLLHLGARKNRLDSLTRGPKHHFFGYYDKSPWNSSGRYILAHEVDFNDRPPDPTDHVGVGIIDTQYNRHFDSLCDSWAWNWQQGCMAQWHPADREYLFAYNDRRDGRLVGVVRHIEKGEQTVYQRPLYALLPDGKTGFSVDFARLAVHRPGYGYVGSNQIDGTRPSPRNDGLWKVELNSGQSELIVPLAELAARNPSSSMHEAWHYINHIQPSRSGLRIAFFHIWQRHKKTWEARLYSCRPDGSELVCLLDTGFISHYDWRDDETLLVWAQPIGGQGHFHILHHTTPRDENPSIFSCTTVQEDGHCSFSPDGKWVLNDTYPDAHEMRNLMLLTWPKGERRDIARVYSPKARWWGELRCDLHPRWSPSGTEICIDSVHEGTRQMYLVDVRDLVA